jgi:hypothetical protein
MRTFSNEFTEQPDLGAFFNMGWMKWALTKSNRVPNVLSRAFIYVILGAGLP